MNNYVLVTLDSCRFDSVSSQWSELENLPRIGTLQEAVSLATWTQPAHLNFMTGRLPWAVSCLSETSLHTGGRGLHQDIGFWDRRLGCEAGSILDDGFRIEPRLRELGYRLDAVVSARPIGTGSHFAQLFDRHVFVGRHGDTLLRALEHLDFTAGPVFLVLNLCETHYPYFDGGYDERFSNRWVSGLAGQARVEVGERLPRPVFSTDELQELRLRQKRAVRYLDGLLPRLFETLPENTFLTVTADHGECFGESGQFGHGEVSDPVVLRVPLVEGMRP